MRSDSALAVKVRSSLVSLLSLGLNEIPALKAPAYSKPTGSTFVSRTTTGFGHWWSL